MPSPGNENHRSFVLQPGFEPALGYRLVERLGIGGFGEVWKAENQGGFHVALKFVRLDAEAAAVERRTFDILRGIRHPNLLTPFDAWQLPDFLVIAMELADRTLKDRFREAVAQGSIGIPYEELIEYLSEAAKGIDYLNAYQHKLDGKEHMGIQHRDIKPQNILLVGNGVKVADFGLARRLERSVTSHTGGLTIAYAAPEFFKGQTSSQSDQYSLAVSYCELRGGRLPFHGSPAQVMAGHTLHPPDLTMLPEEEQPIVARALAKEPKERWPNCRTFAEALRSCRPPASPDTPAAEERPGSSAWYIPLSVDDSTADQPSPSLSPVVLTPVPVPVLKKDTVPVEGVATDPNRPLATALAQGPSGSRAGRRAKTWSILAAGLLLWVSDGSQPPGVPALVKTKSSFQLIEPTRASVESATALGLRLPERLTLRAGEKRSFRVRAIRDNIEGPIALRLEHLPAGVTTSDVTIPAGASDADVALSAAADAAQGDQEIRVVAVAGSAQSQAHFQLSLQRPATLGLDIARTLVFEAGKRATLPVKVLRDGYTGPVRLTFEGLPQAIEPIPEITVRPDEDAVPITLRATGSANAIQKVIKVVASSGALKAEAHVQLQIQPAPSVVHREKGDEYFGAGQYEQAIREYTEALRLDPEDAIAYHNRGYAYRNLKEYDKAIDDYTQAARLNPKDATTYHNRGVAYSDRQEYDKAIDDFTEAIRLKPKDIVSYQNRARAHAARGDETQARADREKAAQLRQSK